MVKVVVSGYYGFGNAGDEAMLAAIIEVITDIEPNIRITVISGDAADTSHRHGVNAVYRLNYPGIIKELSACDLLISGGGSLLQDVTSDRSLYYYLSIVYLAKKLGKPVMLYSQGIGPVRGQLARKAMRQVCNMADLITVRDEGSSFELRNMGITRPVIKVTADPVLALNPVDKQFGRKILQNYRQEGNAPLVSIAVREWKDWSHYKQVLAETADYLITEYGAKIIFLPMQFPEDILAAEKVMRRMREQAVILRDKYSIVELMSLVGNCDLLIGIRLHALVFAAIMNVPVIGLSYDPKIERFMESLKEPCVGKLKDITTSKLLEKAAEFFSDNAEFKENLRRNLRILRNKAFSNAVEALSLLDIRLTNQNIGSDI